MQYQEEQIGNHEYIYFWHIIFYKFRKTTIIANNIYTIYALSICAYRKLFDQFRKENFDRIIDRIYNLMNDTKFNNTRNINLKYFKIKYSLIFKKNGYNITGFMNAIYL